MVRTLAAYGMRVAHAAKTRGTCARRQVGCVLLDKKGRVLSTGYNGVPPKVPHCREGPKCPGALFPSGQGLDQCLAIHAEINAIAQCRDISEVHIACVTTMPCASCLKALMVTGCKCIVYDESYPSVAIPGHILEMWHKDGRKILHYDLQDV